MGKFKLGEKAPRKEAEKALRAHAAAACDHRFTVKFENDDGGTLICLYVEVEDPSAPLDAGIRDALWEPKWMGWRYIIIKCPIDYIEYILEGKKWEG
tara:strand:+ start:993 stop:1283 length:291 start_codon:yes stop_codon:yes gene_type:complete